MTGTPQCGVCHQPGPHETGSIEDWDGGRWPICEASACYQCDKTSPTARIDRVNVCTRCEPFRAAAVAHQAAARRHAGEHLTRADLRALDGVDR